MPACTPPARALHPLFPCPAAADPRCPPRSLHPAACGTSPRPSPLSSASDGTPQSPLLRSPSPCRVRSSRSPPFPARKSKIYLQSAWQTVCLHRAPATARSCPPLPSTRRSSIPTWRPHSTPATPTPARSLSCPQEIRSSSAVPVLPTPPVPAAPHLPPCRTCSETPRSPAPPPAAPAKCVPASAASVHPSPPPPGSRHPSAPPRER